MQKKQNKNNAFLNGILCGNSIYNVRFIPTHYELFNYIKNFKYEPIEITATNERIIADMQSDYALVEKDMYEAINQFKNE